MLRTLPFMVAAVTAFAFLFINVVDSNRHEHPTTRSAPITGRLKEVRIPQVKRFGWPFEISNTAPESRLSFQQAYRATLNYHGFSSSRVVYRTIHPANLLGNVAIGICLSLLAFYGCSRIMDINAVRPKLTIAKLLMLVSLASLFSSAFPIGLAMQLNNRFIAIPFAISYLVIASAGGIGIAGMLLSLVRNTTEKCDDKKSLSSD